MKIFSNWNAYTLHNSLLFRPTLLSTAISVRDVDYLCDTFNPKCLCSAKWNNITVGVVSPTRYLYINIVVSLSGGCQKDKTMGDFSERWWCRHEGVAGVLTREKLCGKGEQWGDALKEQFDWNGNERFVVSEQGTAWVISMVCISLELNYALRLGGMEVGWDICDVVYMRESVSLKCDFSITKFVRIVWVQWIEVTTG